MGRDCRWEHPGAPALRWLWKEEAIGAVVEFRGGTRAGFRASAETARARMDEDRDEEVVWGSEGSEGGPGLP